MRHTVLPLFLLLVLTGCNERNSLSAPTPAPLPADEIVIEQPKIIEHTDMIKVPKVVKEKSMVEEVEAVEKVKKIAKKYPKVQSYTKRKQEIFSGGIMTDGLDIGTIRLGKEGTTTRLVFDSYKWNTHSNTPSIRAHETGYYTFTYEPKKRRITAIINGYRGFSALHNAKVRTFGSNPMVRKLTMEKYLDDSGFKFMIELKQNAKVNVFDLKAPGRIIVDISPL
jgi:hypothetical protein